MRKGNSAASAASLQVPGITRNPSCVEQAELEMSDGEQPDEDSIAEGHCNELNLPNRFINGRIDAVQTEEELQKLIEVFTRKQKQNYFTSMRVHGGRQYLMQTLGEDAVDELINQYMDDRERIMERLGLLHDSDSAEEERMSDYGDESDAQSPAESKYYERRLWFLNGFLNYDIPTPLLRIEFLKAEKLGYVPQGHDQACFYR